MLTYMRALTGIQTRDLSVRTNQDTMGLPERDLCVLIRNNKHPGT
jgi:hypothetical protein